MKQYDVWNIVPHTSIPSICRCVKHKWILDIKINGIFRARLVACGYSQIPGVDFMDAYSPVINDAAFRIMIVIQMIWKLNSKIIDVETAFLHGELDQEIYMNCPKGLDLKPADCLVLMKSLYGDVQSAHQIFQKLVEVLKSIGFSQCKADPCLLIKEINDLGVVIIAVYVDDCYAIGHEPALNDTIQKKHEKGLKIEKENKLSDYFSCEILFNVPKHGWTVTFG
jgi:Reverse transcriptase (RNA-dependent DNA polymerase)